MFEYIEIVWWAGAKFIGPASMCANHIWGAGRFIGFDGARYVQKKLTSFNYLATLSSESTFIIMGIVKICMPNNIGWGWFVC